MSKKLDLKAQEWLDNNELSYTIWNNKYRLDEETFDEWLDRVSGGDSKIRKLIYKKKFLFGGRTLSNRGTNRGSFSNCYSSGFVPDSLEGILDINTKIALTFKAQGGQGLSLSHIRPKGSLINNTFESDGIVPFMEMFNTTTESIMQGGSRKGALLMSIDIWHKEAEAFIKIKSDSGKINKANLSLEIDDDFMKIIANYYKNPTKETPTITMSQQYGNNTISYEVKPVELYKTLCEHACKYAEPGIIFSNKFRNYNIMELDDNYKIETCNPCGEQPLPKHGACNLSSINLSEYVCNPFTDAAYIDKENLALDVHAIVKAMDVVLEENLPNHALEEQREMARKYRNLGIGIMGLADMFVKMGITYGDKQSVEVTESIMKFIFRQSVFASAENAREKGNFPGYTPKVWDSTIMKNAFTERELESLKQKDCLRNCSLLSVAPTGSIGTMLNISTGVEPFFMIQYKRNTKSLEKEETSYIVNIKALEEYHNITEKNDIPKYFITSAQIDWHNRILIQSALQKYTDTAISSTINLPKGTTPEEIEWLYLYAWEQGLKGITVYVEGSRDPILASVDTKPEDLVVREVPKRPDTLPADCYAVKAKGEQYIVMIGLYQDKPYEIFAFKPNTIMKFPMHKGTITKKGKNHYSFDSEYLQIENIRLENDSIFEKAVTFYSSMLLRHGAKPKFLVKTTKKIDDKMTSFTSAICRVLSRYIPAEQTEEKCPNCGGALIREGGCIHCTQCEYSKCE